MKFIDVEKAEKELNAQFKQIYKLIGKKVKPEDYFIKRNQAYFENITKMAFDSFIEYIKAKATADVVEVKSGRWEEYDDYIICSFCEKEFNIFDNCTETFNYCPNCGARMDGGNENA